MEVGYRVEVGGNRGTIRYIGPLDGYDGQWVGIEWDDQKRGKHDGAVAGKRYFHANGEKSASFVRSSNVRFGRKIDEEMNSRYAVHSEMNTFEIGVKMIDFVAMEKIHGKQRNIYKLRYIVLDSMHVAFPPDPDSPSFKFCTELNLYHNLISKWKDLLDILSFFPSLRFLNLRKNYMEPGMKSISDLSSTVSAPIFHLVISDCRIDQETARRILKLFPRVRELYIASNKLETYEVLTPTCGLQLLDLEENHIENFSRISSLFCLQSLCSLNLSNCGLSEIKLGDPVGFSALESLYIRNNLLKGWSWIDEIAKLPALIRLYVKGNLNLDEEFGLNTREAIIAKLPRLIELDRCDISHLERRSAEIFFLDKYGLAPVASEHQKDIERLKHIYGAPNVAQPTPVGIRLLKLKFVFNDKDISRSVPASMPVQKLYGMASRLFQLDIRKIVLYAENVNGQLTFEFDNPFRSLNFFDLSDNDIIRIREV